MAEDRATRAGEGEGGLVVRVVVRVVVWREVRREARAVQPGDVRTCSTSSEIESVSVSTFSRPRFCIHASSPPPSCVVNAPDLTLASTERSADTSLRSSAMYALAST
jgi:hypothetical protein